MYATSNSTKPIKMDKRIDTTVMPILSCGPNGPTLTVIKIKNASPSTIECPAKIFAKRRIINANGLVNMPTTSMTGIMGTGAFNQTGTSGQNISLQYSLVPKIFTVNSIMHMRRF